MRISVISFIAIALIASGLIWYSHNNERKTMENDENIAYDKVCDITDPDSIDSLYCYLENYANMQNRSVGDGRQISSDYKYPNESHVNTILEYLENYYKDYDNEEKAYESCKDTTSCKKYLEKYKDDLLVIDNHHIQIKTRHNAIKDELSKLRKQAKDDEVKANLLKDCLEAITYTEFVNKAQKYKDKYGETQEISKKYNDFNENRQKILKKINNKEWSWLENKQNKKLIENNLKQNEKDAVQLLKEFIERPISEEDANKRTNLTDQKLLDNNKYVLKTWDDVIKAYEIIKSI